MPVIEKTVVVNAKVEDLWGLYADLRRSDFQVRNVAMDERGTYVYLEPSEEKDPTSVVESWVGKPAPKSSPILREIRIKELKKIEIEEEKRLEAKLEEERRRQQASATDDDAIITGKKTLEDLNPSQKPSQKVSFLKRLFRKFI